MEGIASQNSDALTRLARKCPEDFNDFEEDSEDDWETAESESETQE